MAKGVIQPFQFFLSDSRAIVAQHYHKKGNLQVNLSQLYNLIVQAPASLDQAHNAVYDVQMVTDMFDQLNITTKDLLIRE